MSTVETDAGPELDGRIAVQVMGWEWDAARRWPLADSLTETEWAELMSDDAMYWSPSTNIAQAWQVAEKLRIAVIPRGAGGWYAMRAEHDESGYFEIPLADGDDPPGPDTGAAMGDTAPLAICRAALLPPTNFSANIPGAAL